MPGEQCPGLPGQCLREVHSRGVTAETSLVTSCHLGGESEADSNLILCSSWRLSLTLRGRGNSFTTESGSTSCRTLVTLCHGCLPSEVDWGPLPLVWSEGDRHEFSGLVHIAITFMCRAQILLTSIYWLNNFFKENCQLSQKVLDLRTGFL